MNSEQLKQKCLLDENFISQMIFKIKNPETRIEFFNTISDLGNHWQKNPTPLPVVYRMLEKTSILDKKILVLFNIEFLQVLVEEQKINPKNIYFIADNELEYLCAIKIFKVQSYRIKHSYIDDKGEAVYKIPDLKNLLKDIDMKFDLVFTNPPYNDAIDIEILSSVYPFVNEVIAIHPSPWLYDKRDKIKANFKSAINTHVKSIEILPVNSFAGIQLPNKINIIHIDANYTGSFVMKEIDKEPYNFDSILDLTPASSEHKLFEPFFTKIEEYIKKNGSLFEHTIDISTFPIGIVNFEDEWYCQLADTIGQPDRPEHYGFLLKDWTGNYGLRKTGLDANGNPLIKIRKEKEVKETAIKNSFKFSTMEEMHNFIDALRTDFMRFCLVKVKKNKHLESGELKFVPWLDFTQKWDDKKLFETFEISEDIQKAIKEFIPEYYGIK